MSFDSEFWKVTQKQSNDKFQTPVKKDKDKKQRNHRKWLEGYVMKSIGSITSIENKQSRKRYIIHFIYADEKNKQHKASVRFGLKDKQYLVDSGDKEVAKIFSQSCRNLKNQFHHNYWEMYLLNTCRTMQEAHARYRIQFNLL